MGTREVYEEKFRTGAHLRHDPTINPGLGSPRCPRCLSLLNPTAGEGDWAITSVLHDATSVAGCGLVHCYLPCTGLTRVPSLLMFSGASAAFGAYVFPRFAQLTVTSYYAAPSGSQYAVSQITRHVESAHLSDADEKST